MMLICMIILGIIFYIYYTETNKHIEVDSEREQSRCYNCGYRVEDGHNYCPNCKEKLKKKCSNCGKMIGVNWRYCPYCNHNSSGGGRNNEI